MTLRDRLAADLIKAGWTDRHTDADMGADRLIALGWTRPETCDPPCGDCCTEHPHWTHWHPADALDEERLARALAVVQGEWTEPWNLNDASLPAAIAMAYREDAG